MLFSTNGYQLVVMPMITDKAQAYAKKQAEAKQAEPETEPVAEPATEPETEQAEAEPEAEPTKARRSRAKVKTA